MRAVYLSNERQCLLVANPREPNSSQSESSFSPFGSFAPPLRLPNFPVFRWIFFIVDVFSEPHDVRKRMMGCWPLFHRRAMPRKTTNPSTIDVRNGQGIHQDIATTPVQRTHSSEPPPLASGTNRRSEPNNNNSRDQTDRPLDLAIAGDL